MFKKQWKEVKNNLLPKAQVELGKAVKNAKVMLAKGEVYLKDVSQKGLKNSKKLALTIKKEKLCHDLGKLTLKTPKAKIAQNNKISYTIAEIKKIEKEIKKIK